MHSIMLSENIHVKDNMSMHSFTCSKLLAASSSSDMSFFLKTVYFPPHKQVFGTMSEINHNKPIYLSIIKANVKKILK